MKIIRCDFKPLRRSSVPTHSHNCIEWHYIIAGRCGFDIGNDHIDMRTGDFFAIDPTIEHGLRMRTRQDWLLQYIVQAECENTEDEKMWQAWKKQHANAQQCITHIGTARHGLFARLSTAVGSQHHWQLQAASNRFSALLCDCLAEEAPRDDTHPYIQQCLRIMQQSLHDLLSIEELAETLQLNKSYLIRLFKAHIGQPPLQYFTHLKMELASQLLRDEKLHVHVVSERLGYQAAAHFSRIFKKWSGMSPVHYAHAHIT